MSTPSARHLTDSQVEIARTLLGRARNIPGLAERYTDIAEINDAADLSHLPPITKNDLALAIQETAATAGKLPAYIFASGGTTSTPNLSYIPADLFVDEITGHWTPLGRTDIFLNAYHAGKLWSSHHFHNQMAAASGSRVLPVGNMTDQGLDAWIEFCAAQKVTALGATPSTLRTFLTRACELGRKLPHVRALLWVGESWDEAIDAAAQEATPAAGRWGLYGSTETWVIGCNTPKCNANIFHVLPYQHIQVDAAGVIDVTCLHAAGLNLMLRYRPGDGGGFAKCKCGSSSLAIQVNGRRDGIIKFRGSLLKAEEIVTEAKRWPGVRRAQVVLRRSYNYENMEVHVVTEPGSPPELQEELRRHILATNMDIDSVFTEDPEGFQVCIVRNLTQSDRTAKTPSLIDRRPG